MAQGIKRCAAKPDNPNFTSTTSLAGEGQLLHVLWHGCSASPTHLAQKQVTSQVTQTCLDLLHLHSHLHLSPFFNPISI